MTQTHIDGQTTLEFTTAKGRTVRVGQHYRDNRTNNVRDLIVDSIGVYQPPAYGGIEKPAVCSVTCKVSRPRGGGDELLKPLTLDANQLTGRDYVLIEDEAGVR